MKQKLLLVAALAGAVVAQPSHAASSASVSLSNLSVTLVDLNPNDGVLPSIAWYNPPGMVGASQLRSHVFDSSSWEFPIFDATSNSYWGPISVSASTVNGNATSSVTPGSDLADPTSGAILSASGSTVGTATVGGTPTYYGASVLAPYSQFGGVFSLSSGTLAIFSVDAIGTAVTSVGYQQVGAVEAVESAFASGSMALSWTPGFQSTSEIPYAEFNLSAGYEYGLVANPVDGSTVFGRVGQSRSYVGQLTASLQNDTGGDRFGYIWMAATIDGRSGVAAVPEPETYALMLAGLGMVGFVARRRAARA